MVGEIYQHCILTLLHTTAACIACELGLGLKRQTGEPCREASALSKSCQKLYIYINPEVISVMLRQVDTKCMCIHHWQCMETGAYATGSVWRHVHTPLAVYGDRCIHHWQCMETCAYATGSVWSTCAYTIGSVWSTGAQDSRSPHTSRSTVLPSQLHINSNRKEGAAA